MQNSIKLTIFITLLGLLLGSSQQQYAQSKPTKIELTAPSLTYKVRGDRYRRLGLLSKALNEYEKALSIKNEYPECYYWSAVIFKKKQLFTQSLFKIKSALHYKERFPSLTMYYDTLFLEIEIYLALNDSESILEANRLLDAAMTSLKRLRARRGADFKPYLQYRLGRGYFLKGKIALIQETFTEKDIAWFDQAIRFNYKPAFAYYHKYLHYKKTDLRKAKQSLGQAIKLNPNIVLDFYKNVE